ncbi:MAG: MBL fold metallo-hydrolase [Gammaproteobacteria bacterium]|nr:MBL fold metallo-hydrolase [Gammaproteobacteria bacterium]
MRISLSILLLVMAGASHAQFASSFKSTEVVPGILMIEGADGFGGGNMALLIGNDHVAMIDDGLDPIAATLLAFVKEKAGRPIDFVVNTHVHGDHAGGNAHFAADGTIVFAHDNIRKRLLEDSEPAGGDAGLPVVTFAEGVTFHLNGLAANVFHLPAAHTDGDAAIYFPDVNVIHTGDVMFNFLFPYIDLDNGGTVTGYIAAQKHMIAMADDETIIIPGHGPLASKEDLQKNLMMLTDSNARIKMLVDQGKTIDEVLSENPLAVYDEQYNWQFITTERFTRTIYRALTGGE